MGQTLGSYCIWVTDMDRAVYFWETLMGLDVQLHTDLGTIKEVVLASNDGGSRLQLAHDTERDAPLDHGYSLWKLYVNTDDCEGVYKRADRRGVRVGQRAAPTRSVAGRRRVHQGLRRLHRRARPARPGVAARQLVTR